MSRDSIFVLVFANAHFLNVSQGGNLTYIFLRFSDFLIFMKLIASWMLEICLSIPNVKISEIALQSHLINYQLFALDFVRVDRSRIV